MIPRAPLTVSPESHRPRRNASPSALARSAALVFLCLGTLAQADDRRILDRTQSYEVRQRAISGLSQNLPQQTVSALMGFLGSIEKPEKLTQTEWNTLKNDILDKLLVQRRFPTHLSDLILRLVDDPSQDVVWRDYVLQKFPVAFGRETEDAYVRHQLRETLWRLARVKEHTFSGTSLLALERLSRQKSSEVKRERVGTEALRIAISGEFTPANRQTALHVAAMCGSQGGAVRLARRWAPSDAFPVGMRLAAVNVLGTLGAGSDAGLLAELATSGDARLKTAARRATKRLSTR